MVFDQVAKLSQFMAADAEVGPGGNDLLARAGSAIAEGRYGEAEAYLDAALSIDPYDNQALRRLAAVYRLTGRSLKARSYEQMAREGDAADSVSKRSPVSGLPDRSMKTATSWSATPFSTG